MSDESKKESVCLCVCVAGAGLIADDDKPGSSSSPRSKEGRMVGRQVSMVEGSSGQDGSLRDHGDGRVVQGRVSRSDGLVLGDGGHVVRQSRLDPVVASEPMRGDGSGPGSRDQGRGRRVQRGGSIVQAG